MGTLSKQCKAGRRKPKQDCNIWNMAHRRRCKEFLVRRPHSATSASRLHYTWCMPAQVHAGSSASRQAWCYQHRQLCKPSGTHERAKCALSGVLRFELARRRNWAVKQQTQQMYEVRACRKPALNIVTLTCLASGRQESHNLTFWPFTNPI